MLDFIKQKSAELMSRFPQVEDVRFSTWSSRGDTRIIRVALDALLKNKQRMAVSLAVNALELTMYRSGSFDLSKMKIEMLYREMEKGLDANPGVVDQKRE